MCVTEHVQYVKYIFYYMYVRNDFTRYIITIRSTMTVYKSNVAVIFFPSWWKSNKN